MPGAPERQSYRYLRHANDRFKLEARSRLGWSMLAAATLHVLTFFALPTWRGAPRQFETPPWQGSIEWVVVSLPAVVAPQEVEPLLGGDGLGADLDVGSNVAEGEDARLTGGEVVGVSEALREFLLASSTIVPTLAEPEPVPVSTDSPAGSGSVRIEGNASTVALEGLAAADSLALELLTALRPELVVLDPSTWILIRNPTAVESFMRQRATDLPELSGARRSTSVALWIDESGSVEWAEISQSSGRTDLDELALELFSEVIAFRPARDRGVRIPTTAVFTVHFPW